MSEVEIPEGVDASELNDPFNEITPPVDENDGPEVTFPSLTEEQVRERFTSEDQDGNVFDPYATVSDELAKETLDSTADEDVEVVAEDAAPAQERTNEAPPSPLTKEPDAVEKKPSKFNTW